MKNGEAMINTQNLLDVVSELEAKVGRELADWLDKRLQEEIDRPQALHVHEEATEDSDESWHLECPVCHTQDAITLEQWVKNVCSIVETGENEFQTGSDEINWDAVTDSHMRCEYCGVELEAPDNLICY